MFLGHQIWDRFYTECVGGIMWENVFSVFLLFYEHVCECTHVCVWKSRATRGSRVVRMMGPTHAGTPQLFWFCVLYKDFITRCFREVFMLLGESKCQWHPSLARMSSVNKQGVSLAVLLLPADSLCQCQARKCHLSADSCLCCAHTGTRRESPAAPHPAVCAAELSTDPQTCHALPWQHFTIYLNRAGAERVPGKLLHSPPFREDLSSGKEDNEGVSSLVVQSSPFYQTW